MSTTSNNPAEPLNPDKPIGNLHPPKSMFLRTTVGDATSGELKYELTTGMNGSPLVRSKQTGKWFDLSWQDILTLAVKAGIDA